MRRVSQHELKYISPSKVLLPDKRDIIGTIFRDWRAEGNPTHCKYSRKNNLKYMMDFSKVSAFDSGLKWAPNNLQMFVTVRVQHGKNKVKRGISLESF